MGRGAGGGALGGRGGRRARRVGGSGAGPAQDGPTQWVFELRRDFAPSVITVGFKTVAYDRIRRAVNEALAGREPEARARVALTTQGFTSPQVDHSAKETGLVIGPSCVVLGGASGSFIGHLDGNYELSNGRGLAQIEEGVWAASGLAGVMHLLEWDGARRQFAIARRIGALPEAGGLAVDAEGRVRISAGLWRWDDPPDSPLREGWDIALAQLAPLGRGRWAAWGEGADERFGAAVWLQADGPRLWVADRDRHRVLCFDLATRRVRAAFGVVDAEGSDLAHLDRPESLAACGGRCVVHDAGNQRLLRLESGPSP